MVTDGADANIDSASIVWAGPVKHPAVAELGSYLTVIELEFYDPASQITSDLYIEQAPTDESVNTTRVETELVSLGGVPIGWLIVLLGLVLLVALIVVGAVVLVRVTSRRTRA